MMATIAPFWDANETWLVMGTVLILVAFPNAQGIIMTELYIPIACMLLGLTIRGASFDFCIKDRIEHKTFWNYCFYLGSVLSTLSQGYMLGKYIQNFSTYIGDYAFSVGLAIILLYVYRLLGACWLIAKTSGTLQIQAHAWAVDSLYCIGLGFMYVMACTPEYILTLYTWSSEGLTLWSILITSASLTYIVFLRSLYFKKYTIIWAPYLYTIMLYSISYSALCLHIYPYIIPGRMTIWEGSADAESLHMIFYGFIIVLPMIILYNIILFYIFHPKVDTHNSYDNP